MRPNDNPCRGDWHDCNYRVSTRTSASVESACPLTHACDASRVCTRDADKHRVRIAVAGGCVVIDTAAINVLLRASYHKYKRKLYVTYIQAYMRNLFLQIMMLILFVINKSRIKFLKFSVR